MNLKNFVAPSKRRDVYKAAVMLSYGALKLFPAWDPLRGDPRFEQIVASLAPKNAASPTTLLNNTTYTIGCNNILGADPPNAFGFQHGNANNYPGGLYDNLGRFWYVELVKKF